MINRKKRNETSLFCRIGLVFWLITVVCPAWVAAGENIGFVNLQKAVSGTKDWKKKFTALKKDFQKEQSIIESKKKRVQAMLDELNKQSFVLSPGLKEKKEEKFRSQRREFERYVKDREEEFTIKEKRISEDIVKKMLKVIRKIGKEKKISLIMDQSTVLYFHPEKDLTDLVIRTYDRTNK